MIISYHPRHRYHTRKIPITTIVEGSLCRHIVVVVVVGILSFGFNEFTSTYSNAAAAFAFHQRQQRRQQQHYQFHSRCPCCFQFQPQCTYTSSLRSDQTLLQAKNRRRFNDESEPFVSQTLTQFRRRGRGGGVRKAVVLRHGKVPNRQDEDEIIDNLEGTSGSYRQTEDVDEDDGDERLPSSPPATSTTKEWSIIRQAVQQPQTQRQDKSSSEQDGRGGLASAFPPNVQFPPTIQRTSPAVEYLIFTFPILMAAISLETHQSFALEFHSVCDLMTKMNWDESSKSQTDTLDLVRSGLNGPVVTSIAILFGTLVANTISTLIDRNVSIQRCGIAMGEEVRMTRLMLDSFSSYYRDEGNRRLDMFVERWLADFWSGSTTIASLRKLTPYLEDCVRLIHDANRDQNEKQSGAAISEAYTSLSKLRSLQAETMAQSQRSYPWFHYANLIVLGFGICVIFLIDTDPDTVQNDFSAEPQLALSWSLLVGTLSMLFVVVCDLTSPLAGITRRIFASEDLNLKQIEIYVRCWNTPSSSSNSSSSSSNPIGDSTATGPSFCEVCNEDE